MLGKDEVSAAQNGANNMEDELDKHASLNGSITEDLPTDNNKDESLASEAGEDQVRKVDIHENGHSSPVNNTEDSKLSKDETCDNKIETTSTQNGHGESNLKSFNKKVVEETDFLVDSNTTCAESKQNLELHKESDGELQKKSESHKESDGESCKEKDGESRKESNVELHMDNDGVINGKAAEKTPVDTANDPPRANERTEEDIATSSVEGAGKKFSMKIVNESAQSDDEELVAPKPNEINLVPVENDQDMPSSNDDSETDSEDDQEGEQSPATRDDHDNESESNSR